MQSFTLYTSPSTSLISYTRHISLSKRTPSISQSPPSISLQQKINGLNCFSSSPTNLFGSTHNFSLLKTKAHISPKPIQSSSQNTNPKKQGAKIIPLLISISIGLVIRFIVPKPIQVSTQAWQLLAIFLSTNIGLILGPLPIGAWAFLSLTTTVFTKTLTFENAFKGFTSDVIWLIVLSFFFARGFVKTGLGDRIATYFVKWFGKSALGLSYGLTMGETLVAPSMPSTIARAGGIFLPIIKSTLLLSTGRDENDPKTRKLGSYLIQSQLQSAGNSSALFLTAAANNLLCLKLAEELGVKIASPWVTWFKAASLPAFVSLLATPYILYKIFPPETEETLNAPAVAALKLEQMGPVTKNEWVMVGTMLLAVSLWISEFMIKNDLFADYGGMDLGSHSLTLGRLYAWEKKLCEEVKVCNFKATEHYYLETLMVYLVVFVAWDTHCLCNLYWYETDDGKHEVCEGLDLYREGRMMKMGVFKSIFLF